MLRIGALACTALLAGCGEPDIVGENVGVSSNQIERLSTPKKAEADPRASARIEPLTPADLDGAGIQQTACEFDRMGRLLLVTTSSDAVARINGQLLHFTHSSPVGPTGGFFEDRRISISVGRSAESAVDAHAGFRARITVTNRRTRARSELDGVWRCA